MIAAIANSNPVYGAALRIHFVEQGPYLRGAPVGRDADSQTGRVAPHRALAQVASRSHCRTREDA